MAEAGEERIEELLRQWRESATPRVGLQLAEEYRQTGRHQEACELLEASLEAHPGHLSSLVALGKARLDLDQAQAAAERFERVLERDPTHLVAGKMLIEAYLRRGDGDAARERLELYRLLNSGDPDLEDLERRIGELDSGGEGADAVSDEPAPVAEPEMEEPPDEAAAAPEELAAAPLAEEEPPVIATAPEAASAEPAPSVEPAAEAEAEPGESAGKTRPSAGADLETGTADPFGPLAGGDDERRWLAGLGADGIFGAEPPPEPAPEAAAPEPSEPAVAEELAGAPSVTEAEPGPEPGTEEELAGAAEAIGSEPAPAEPVEAGPGSAAPGAKPGERATNTLGELYLTQGHLEDAERVFRTVLERRPDDRAAMAGLAEVERRRGTRITASDLMRWAASRGHAAEPADRTGRSASMLRAYLARLRDRSPADVS